MTDERDHVTPTIPLRDRLAAEIRFVQPNLSSERLDMLLDRLLPVIRDGADDTPPVEAAVPTPGQLVARIIDGDADERLRWASWSLESSAQAGRCFEMNHAGAVEERQYLRRRLNRAQQTIDDVRIAVAGRFGPVATPGDVHVHISEGPGSAG